VCDAVKYPRSNSQRIVRCDVMTDLRLTARDERHWQWCRQRARRAGELRCWDERPIVEELEFTRVDQLEDLAVCGLRGGRPTAPGERRLCSAHRRRRCDRLPHDHARRRPRIQRPLRGSRLPARRFRRRRIERPRDRLPAGRRDRLACAGGTADPPARAVAGTAARARPRSRGRSAARTARNDQY
jgi:hypothetical protein